MNDLPRQIVYALISREAFRRYPGSRLVERSLRAEFVSGRRELLDDALSSKRGGKREGAGRPPHSPLGAKRTVSMKLSPEALAQLDSLTALLGRSRVAIVEDAISDYYHDQRRRSAAVEAAR